MFRDLSLSPPLERLPDDDRPASLRGLAAQLGAFGALAGTPTAEVLEVIADQFGGIVFALDAEGRVTASAGAARRAMEPRRGRSVGRLATEVFADVPELLAALRRALAGAPVELEVTIDGQRYHCEYAPLLGGDGTVTRVVGFAVPVD